jgi:hypothetical protein
MASTLEEHRLKHTVVVLAVRRNFVEKEGFFSRRVHHIHTHPTSFPASATPVGF